MQPIPFIHYRKGKRADRKTWKVGRAKTELFEKIVKSFKCHLCVWIENVASVSQNCRNLMISVWIFPAISSLQCGIRTKYILQQKTFFLFLFQTHIFLNTCEKNNFFRIIFLLCPNNQFSEVFFFESI